MAFRIGKTRKISTPCNIISKPTNDTVKNMLDKSRDEFSKICFESRHLLMRWSAITLRILCSTVKAESISTSTLHLPAPRFKFDPVPTSSTSFNCTRGSGSINRSTAYTWNGSIALQFKVISILLTSTASINRRE